MSEPIEPERPSVDPNTLVELLEIFLLGDIPTLSGNQIAAHTGIPIETARVRWRSLGFTAVGDDAVVFTELDQHAMELTQRMHELGLVGDENEAALIRTLGRSFARLAEWQLTLIGRNLDLESNNIEELATVMAETTPVIEEVMNYVWRRHILSAASRMLLAPAAGDADQVIQAVGFADIVGYTRQSRSLRQQEIARLVDDFEAAALAIITEHHGRIIKTIGDEILFVTDTPADAVFIALKLTNAHRSDPDFPELRVGLAYGPVVARLGDVFGPVVNVASRLTSTARPGKVLVDRALAEELEEHPTFRFRRMRRTAVKGYRRLEPWSVKLKQGRDLFDPVDEVETLSEEPVGAETAD